LIVVETEFVCGERPDVGDCGPMNTARSDLEPDEVSEFGMSLNQKLPDRQCLLDC
jgi:hypothetical protein